MPPRDLTSEQLESIRRLLIDPLREAVKAEVELGHGRLRQAVEQLASHVAAHVESSTRLAADASRRLTIAESELSAFGSFRRRVLVVYAFLAAGMSLVWSIVRDRILKMTR